MKNCDEMVNSLLERRDWYVAKQKKKRKMLTSTVISMSCLCLIVLLGFDMWQGGGLGTKAPEQTLNDAVYPGVKDAFNENKGESADNLVANNKIVINSIQGVSADKMNINLLENDFVELTRDEMIAYYGVDYVPTVPEDITAWEDERSGIYKRNGGSGEVYWDADILNYSNEDFTRTVHLEVDNGNNVLPDYFFFKGTEEKSVINNVFVLIGLSENGYYYADFTYKDIGFHINAKGVTEDEFVAIITSIIE